jgi:hypothetical protein
VEGGIPAAGKQAGEFYRAKKVSRRRAGPGRLSPRAAAHGQPKSPGIFQPQKNAKSTKRRTESSQPKLHFPPKSFFSAFSAFFVAKFPILFGVFRG